MKRLLALSFLILMLALSGCSTQRDIDNSCFVLSLSIDKGKEKAYKFTIQAPQLVKSGEESKNKALSMSVESDDINNANDMINSSLPYVIDYTHCNYVVVCEELAKSKEIFDIMRMVDSLGIPKGMSIMIVAKESAKDFVEGLSGDMDLNIAKEQKNLMMESSQSGIYPFTTVFDYFESLTSTYDVVVPLGSKNKSVEEEKNKEESKAKGDEKQGDSGQSSSKEGESKEGEQSQSSQQKPDQEAIELGKEYVKKNEKTNVSDEEINDFNAETQPEKRVENNEKPSDDLNRYTVGDTIRTGGLPSEIYGSGLIHDGIMVGELNGRETRMLLIGEGKFEKAAISVFIDEGAKQIIIEQIKKPKVKVDVSGKNPKANIKAYLLVSYVGDSMKSVSASEEGSKPLKENEEHLEAFFKENLETVTKKAYSTGCDAFNLGRYFVRKFKYDQDWQAYGWSDKIADCDISIDVDVKINATEEMQYTEFFFNEGDK